ISALEAGQLLVHALLEHRIERLGGRRRASSAPGQHEGADDLRAASEDDEREQPGEQPEASLWRLREDSGAELRDERVLDLPGAVARRDARADICLHALGDGGVRLVESRLANRAHELALEIR